MKDFLEKCGEFNVKAESEKNREMCESGFFTGYLRKHPKDNSLIILVVSEQWEPLTTLEFSLGDVINHEVVDEEKGKVKIWVRASAKYKQCSYLTVKARPAPIIPGITRVYRGENVEDIIHACGICPSCGCDCGCDCPCQCIPNEQYRDSRFNASSYKDWRTENDSRARLHKFAFRNIRDTTS